MALVDCPECGRRISEYARACPDCGYPISNPPTLKRHSSSDDRALPESSEALSSGNADTAVSIDCSDEETPSSVLNNTEGSPPLSDTLEGTPNTRASVLRRFGALMLDTTLWWIVCILMYASLIETEIVPEGFVFLLALAVWVLYFGILESRGRGATYGKRLLGIRAVRTKDSQNLSLMVALVRCFPLILLELYYPFVASTETRASSIPSAIIIGLYFPFARMSLIDRLTGSSIVYNKTMPISRESKTLNPVHKPNFAPVGVTVRDTDNTRTLDSNREERREQLSPPISAIEKPWKHFWIPRGYSFASFRPSKIETILAVLLVVSVLVPSLIALNGAMQEQREWNDRVLSPFNSRVFVQSGWKTLSPRKRRVLVQQVEEFASRENARMPVYEDDISKIFRVTVEQTPWLTISTSKTRSNPPTLQYHCVIDRDNVVGHKFVADYLPEAKSYVGPRCKQLLKDGAGLEVVFYNGEKIYATAVVD